MSKISTQAAASREAARRSNGKFGPQPATASSATLGDAPTDLTAEQETREKILTSLAESLEDGSDVRGQSFNIPPETLTAMGAGDLGLRGVTVQRDDDDYLVVAHRDLAEPLSAALTASGQDGGEARAHHWMRAHAAALDTFMERSQMAWLTTGTGAALGRYSAGYSVEGDQGLRAAFDLMEVGERSAQDDGVGLRGLVDAEAKSADVAHLLAGGWDTEHSATLGENQLHESDEYRVRDDAAKFYADNWSYLSDVDTDVWVHDYARLAAPAGHAARFAPEDRAPFTGAGYERVMSHLTPDELVSAVPTYEVSQAGKGWLTLK